MIAAKNDINDADNKTVALEFLKSTFITSNDSNNVDANIVGIDIIIDRLIQETRENPWNKPPDIVFPERDVPGIKARACQTPIIKASFCVQSLLSRFLEPYLSARYSMTPKITIPQPTTLNDRSS